MAVPDADRCLCLRCRGFLMITKTTAHTSAIRSALTAVRKWWKRKQIAAIDRDLDIIRANRDNDYLAERELVLERALMCSQLRGM